MVIRFRPDYRHPFFADVRATPAPLARGECTAIIGTYRELMEAAASGARVKRYVYVLHGSETPFLSEEQRDSLWTRFEVPVFALMLGRRGRLVAWECEVHDGLHTDSRHCDMPRLVRRVDSAQCDCGRPGNRLIVAQPRELHFACAGAVQTNGAVPAKGPAQARSVVQTAVVKTFSAAARPSAAGAYPCAFSAESSASRIRRTFSAVEP
jgi:hypothetical protein